MELQLELKKTSLVKEFSYGPTDHSNKGNTSRYDSSNAKKATPSITSFLMELLNTKAELIATWVVHSFTSIGLCDEEKGWSYLPPFYTKHNIYERRYFENVRIANVNTFGGYGLL